MSTPIRIGIGTPDMGAQPIVIALAPDVGMGTEEVSAQPLVSVGPPLPPEPQPALILPAASLGVVMVGWVLAVIMVAQCGKWALKLLGVKERLSRRRWSRLVLIIPVASACALGYAVGPQVAAPFAVLDRLDAMLLIGLTSGPAAVFGYEALRMWVLPIAPAVVVAVVERLTGITLPDAVKGRAHDLRQESEAMEEIE